MKSLSPSKKLVLAAIGLLLALLILKIGLVLTAKPKVTVDYVAEYNRMTFPQNFDPNENAAEEYQKAFDAFVKMPSQLRGPWKDWPTDFNDADQNTLRQWLASNEQAFEYFRGASRKSRYCLERNVEKDTGMLSMLFPELGPLRSLVEAMTWNAKLNAAQGQCQAAFENILTCYRAGTHKCRTPSLLMEQLVGLGIKEKTLTAVETSIDRIKVEPSDLREFQEDLQGEFNKDTYILDFEAERLMLYDILQRTFVYNKRGTGRLAWSAVKDIRTMCGSAENFKLICKLFLNCLIGPTRNEMIGRIEETFASFEPLKTETPWQIHKKGKVFFERVDTGCCDSFVLDMFSPAPSRPFHKYHQVKAKEKALLTILAIHRYMSEKGYLPATLDELVSTGYLQNVPLDPYSDGPLIYRTDRDNFTLYSLGENFKDDEGKIPESFISTSPHKLSSSKTPSVDIVFWPVRRFEQRMKRFEKDFDDSKDANDATVEP
jgi:hypothetical protein